MQLFSVFEMLLQVCWSSPARAASADTVILGSKHLMVPLGFWWSCAKFLHIQIYKLYALVFLLFLLVTGNSIHYSEIVCIDCHEFSPFVPSRSLFCTLVSPQKADFHMTSTGFLAQWLPLVFNQRELPPSSWSFRPRDETRPPVLPHFLLVPLTLPTSLSIIPYKLELNWTRLECAICFLPDPNWYSSWDYFWIFISGQ